MENELTTLLSKLIEFVENASPVIWAAAEKQVLVSAVQALVWAAVLLSIAGVLAYYARKCYAYGVDDDFIPPAALVCVVSIATGIAAVALALDAIAYILNPTYYAIQNILALVK